MSDGARQTSEIVDRWALAVRSGQVAVIAPDSAEYESAATSYGIVGSPVLVARPTSTEGVVAAVAYAQTKDLVLSIRGGGHSPFGTNDGGMVLDLSGISAVEVLDGGRVRIGGGAVWGDVAKDLQPHGLALTSGDTYSVGVGGLTLGGGVGWMVRQHGLALDSLIEVDVVLASGAVVSASESSEPELFWALRGGGGNFGVVTSFTFQAHPLPGVVAGSVSVDPSALTETLRGWRDVMRNAPEPLNATFFTMPDFGPEMPASAQVLVCHAGDDVGDAMDAIQPLLEVPGVTSHDISLKSYIDMLDEPERPAGVVTIVANNAFAEDFSDELIDNIAAAHAGLGAAVLMIRYLGGALNRVPADATAFAHRRAEILIISAAFLPPDAPVQDVENISELWATLSDRTVGMYGNFASDTGTRVLESMYPPATTDRLRAAKRHYDPGNLFSQNHNIVP